MLAFSWVTSPAEGFDKRAILSAVAGLFQNVEFLDASTLATGDRARTLLRVRLMTEALAGAGLALDSPDIVTPVS
jgi:hypothetical protein